MRRHWITATLCVALLAYAGGWFVAQLLHSSESTSWFPLVLRMGMSFFLAIAAVAGIVAYSGRRGMVKWDRILAEQRLWESGPLGRRWLAHRRKVSDRDPW